MDVVSRMAKRRDLWKAKAKAKERSNTNKELKKKINRDTEKISRLEEQKQELGEKLLAYEEKIESLKKNLSL